VKVPDASGSEVGVMHACGPDIHMTTLVGAQAMLDDGLFKRFPKPDFALAEHCDASLAAGQVGIRAGFTLADSDTVDIIVRGRGGHGAYPHTAIDPIVQATELVLALQTLVSRERQCPRTAVARHRAKGEGDRRRRQGARANHHRGRRYTGTRKRCPSDGPGGGRISGGVRRRQGRSR
jgi:metal-dependent amidase/aminoacylase/carboxypeptidase family protein